MYLHCMIFLLRRLTIFKCVFALRFFELNFIEKVHQKVFDQSDGKPTLILKVNLTRLFQSFLSQHSISFANELLSTASNLLILIL